MSVDRTPGITSIKAHPDRIAVHWQDGQTGTYHHIWLRDNCMCEQCGDRSGGHRYLEIGQIDPAVHPRDSRINHRGNVEIHWDGDEHVTEFSAAWLRQHRCEPETAAQRVRRRSIAVRGRFSCGGDSPQRLSR